MIIYDESSGAKNGKSNRVKALMRVRKKVKRFVQLTATPNSENYLGLWSQMYLLDNGRRLISSIHHLKAVISTLTNTRVL